jgi:hypothetical protein
MKQQTAKEKLKEIVYINLGQASMCWSDIPSGVFDSTKAAELGKEIMDAIDKYIENSQQIMIAYTTGESDGEHYEYAALEYYNETYQDKSAGGACEIS